MLKKVESPFKILNKKEKKSYLIILILIFFSSLIEVVGIGSIVPLSVFLVEGKINFLNFSLNENKNISNIILTIFFIFFLLKFLYLIFVEKQKNNFIFNQQTLIASKLYNIYLNQNLEFHKQKKISTIIQTISSDTPLVAGQFMQSYLILINEIILILFLFLFLLYYNFFLTTFVILLGLIVSLYFKFFLKKKINELSSIKRINQKKTLDLLYSSLNSISEIKIFNLENHFYKKFYNYQDAADRSLNKNVFYESITRPALEFLSFIFLILTILYLARFEDFKDIIPTLGLFVGALFKILPSTNRILTAYYKLNFSTISVNILNEELKKKIDPKVAKPKVNFLKNIKLKDICYYYNDRNFKKVQVLNNLNFEINKGSILGIYGKSGAGKTTLLNIILGFYKAKSGNIYCDGINIDQKSVEWSNLFSYVPQKVYLFPGSIRDNIIFNEDEKNFDLKRYEQSLTISDLENFVKTLEDGDKTMVGEGGSLISGGQAQRIGIARALYFDREIIILDEPTSSLDEQTQKNIILNLKTYLEKNPKKTIIIVTHNQNLLKNCDTKFEIN